MQPALAKRGADRSEAWQSPPVPPDNQSHKGTGDPKSGSPDLGKKPAAPANLHEQGHQANTEQNTTHQGFQQDR